jgi:hypothetical protein
MCCTFIIRGPDGELIPDPPDPEDTRRAIERWGGDDVAFQEEHVHGDVVVRDEHGRRILDD